MGCEHPAIVTHLAPTRVVVVIVPLTPAAVSLGAPCVAARWLACGPLLVLFLFVASSDAAWEVRLEPGLALGGEYSDNVTASSGGANIEDLALTGTPSLRWSFDRQDLRFEGSSALRVERFLNHSDLDGDDPSHRLRATWRLTERWTLAASEEWRESRNLDDLIEAGEIVVQRERRTTNEASVTLQWSPTEWTGVDLDYSNYNSQSEDPTNTDYLLHMVGLTASLQATERLGLFAGANLQDYDFSPTPGDPARRRFFTRNYAAFAGAGYQFSERLDARLQIGARYTEQTTRALALDATTFPIGFVQIEATNGSTNGTFSGTATYTLDRGAIAFSASQDLTATAGAEGTVERRSFGLSANEWFAADWQWTASLSYTENKNDSAQAGVTQRDSLGTYLTAGVRYQINDYLDAQLQVRRLDFRDDGRNTDVEGNSVVLSITARWPATVN